MEYFLKRFTNFLTSHPRILIISLFVMSLVAIYPASQIGTDFNLEGFFPENDPTLTQYEQVAELFGRDDNTIIIALEQPSIFDADFLSTLTDFSDSLLKLPHVSEVRSLYDASQIRASENGGIEVNPYIQHGESVSEKVQQEMLSDSLVKGIYLNDEATVTAVYVDIFEDQNNYPSRAEFINGLHRVIQKFGFEEESYISGIPYFRNGYVNELNAEIVYYVFTGSVLIILLLWYLFRNLRDVTLPLLIVWITILFTVAFIHLTGGYFEIMSSTIAPILLCVGIADSVHMLSKYNDGIMQGLNREESIFEMIKKMGLATFLTSITTAIGFSTLGVSNIIPMKNFGLYTAAGVMLAYVVTMLFLTPFLYTFKQTKRQRVFTMLFYRKTSQQLDKVNAFIARNTKSIVVIGTLIAIVFSIGIFELRVNSKIFDDLSDDTELMRDNTFIGSELTPQFPVEVVFDLHEENGAFNPDLINKLSRLEAHMKSYEEVEKVVSFRDALVRVHEVLTIDNEPFYAESEAQVSQYALLLELSNGDLLERFLDFEYRYLRVTALTQDVGSAKINQIRSELTDFLDKEFSDYDYVLSGTNILVADLTENIVFSLNSSILLAIGFITIILFLMFRSPSLAFIALLPNLFPLIVTAGFMGFAGIDIKPSTAVIFTISFGIVVDDTIHYLSRLRLEMNEKSDMLHAIDVTTNRTGRAIILTSMILLIGFGVLGTSSFDSTQYMGALTCLTIIGALFYDLLFLPALLRMYFLRKLG